jgi:hypothetical protein
MKKNKLRDLKDEDFGIRWDTLSDVSSDIQQKYFEIQEKKEMLRHDNPLELYNGSPKFTLM